MDASVCISIFKTPINLFRNDRYFEEDQKADANVLHVTKKRNLQRW